MRFKQVLPWFLIPVALAIDIALFNVYPFYCEYPWSPNLLLSSIYGLKLYILVAAIHYALIDLALVFIPVVFLWSKDKLVRIGRTLIISLVLLVALDVLTIVLIDYVALFWFNPPNYVVKPLAISIGVIGALDTFYRLIAFPLIFPLIVLEACLRKGEKLLGYASKTAKRLALLAILNLVVKLVAASALNVAINLAIARLNPLWIFTYFRCFNNVTAKLIAIHMKVGTSFTPTLQSWGGIASEALEISVACLIARFVSEGIEKLKS